MATDTIEKWKNPYSAEGYNTLCVWEGTLVEHGQEAGIEKFFLDEFKVHIKYVDKFLTLPGKGGPGGRSDVLFALLDSEMTKFAMIRIHMGDCRWWSDYIMIHHSRSIIPLNILHKYDIETIADVDEKLHDQIQEDPENEHGYMHYMYGNDD